MNTLKKVTLNIDYTNDKIYLLVDNLAIDVPESKWGVLMDVLGYSNEKETITKSHTKYMTDSITPNNAITISIISFLHFGENMKTKQYDISNDKIELFK